MSTSNAAKKRCAWVADDPVYVAYHDTEWGVPVHDDRVLFEFLILEGAQAGLSWRTVLAKREHYQAAFARFDPGRVARYDDARIQQLLADAGLVRNRLKLRSAVTNAQAFLAVQQEFGSFDAYLWTYVGGRPQINRWRTTREVPVRTEVADVLSKDLQSRGFKFVGSTICYAYMQAIGMVNDHTTDCFRHAILSGDRPRSSAKRMAKSRRTA